MAASYGAASRLNAPGDLVFPQQSDDRFAIGGERSPHGSTPLVNGSVALGPGWRRQDVANGHAAPRLGQLDARPLSLRASESLMRFLDLTAGELFFDVEVESDQTED